MNFIASARNKNKNDPFSSRPFKPVVVVVVVIENNSAIVVVIITKSFAQTFLLLSKSLRPILLRLRLDFSPLSCCLCCCCCALFFTVVVGVVVVALIIASQSLTFSRRGSGGFVWLFVRARERERVSSSCSFVVRAGDFLVIGLFFKCPKLLNAKLICARGYSPPPHPSQRARRNVHFRRRRFRAPLSARW